MTAVSPARAARCLAVVLFSLIGGVAGAQSRAAPAADTTQAQVPLLPGHLLRGYSVRFNDVDSAVLLQVERNRQLVDIRYLPRSTATVPGVRYLLKPDAEQDADCAAWRGFR